MRKFRKITAAVLAAAIITTLSGCVDYEKIIRDALISDQTTTEHPAPIIATADVSIPPDPLMPGEPILDNSTTLELNSGNGTLDISRRTRNASKPMGEAETWTIFVYLCGTDLESNGAGCATDDLQEMIDGISSPNVKFVVETGGAVDWSNDLVDSSVKQRFVIDESGISEVYNDKLTNMGVASTLSEFLDWGVENYPAEKMGVVFWNHGGGSISGVCFDENFLSDSLTLRELDGAFTTVFDNMTDKFEFIGFDACLMATLEAANALTPHARYMFASEEIEPGSGWNYAAIGEYLSLHPDADGLGLGRAVCDSFFASCEDIGEADNATLAVVDLSKTDTMIQALNSFSSELYALKDDSDKRSGILRAIAAVENYGGNNRSEGYTNMVDLAGIAEATAEYASGSALVNTVKDAVVYQVRGDYRSGGHGLSIYYPLSIQGSEELDILKEICPSPYYMAFVDFIAYCGETSGSDTDGYDDSCWFDGDCWYSDEEYTNDYWNSYDEDYGDFNINFDNGSTAIDFSETPHLDSEGYYTFTLTDDALFNLDSVYCSVMMSYFTDDGTELMLDLGTDDYVDVDWSTGTVKDNFNGYWFALPDGQPLAAYLIEQNYDYNIYTAPVYLNDELTNLRIRQDYYSDGTYTTTMLGTWDGIDENGFCSRDIRPLKIGDRLCPEYDAYDAFTGEYSDYFYGDDWVYGGDDMLEEALLYEGDYYYSFEIYDIYGGVLYTDYVLFGVEADGTLYYYTE